MLLIWLYTISEDSINRDAQNIRRQLTHYNQNCRDQTTKVVDLGFTLEDFIEIHTNRGVKKPPQRLKRQDEGLDIADEDDQHFSSACNLKRTLPDYFEASLGGLKLKAKTDGTEYGLSDGGGVSSPWVIVGIIITLAVFALCFGYFLFRRGLKAKQRKAQEARVTHIIASRSLDDNDSFDGDDKMRKLHHRDMAEKRKGMRGGKANESFNSGMDGGPVGDDASRSNVNISTPYDPVD